MPTTSTPKFGIYDFAFIRNKDFINELNELLAGTLLTADYNKFQRHFYQTVTRKGQIEFLDKYGDMRDKSGKPIPKEAALYATYDTGFKNKEGNIIYGIFSRKTTQRGFEGIQFANKKNVEEIIESNLLFRMGQIIFDDPDNSWDNAFSFLQDLAETAIPEKWTYGKQSSAIPHPILKAFVEHTFTRLTKEKDGSKIVMDDNQKYILFNLGLLNNYFRPIYIVSEQKDLHGRKVYVNPFILKTRTTLAEISFTKDGKLLSEKTLPDPAQFYDNINEIIFKPEPEYYDPNEEKLHHIIAERSDRFPQSYQNRNTTELAVILDTAVKCAYELAKRNYKLIVPQYRPTSDKIQYLMPIYLGSTFNKLPDFALVLDNDSGYYKPETILELDDAYQNARLIAKPDNFWLNPDQI